jgi:hypothetical protein
MPSLTTVDALLVLACFDAPLLWVEQLEAHELCPELELDDMWSAQTMYSRLTSAKKAELQTSQPACCC